MVWKPFPFIPFSHYTHYTLSFYYGDLCHLNRTAAAITNLTTMSCSIICLSSHLKYFTATQYLQNPGTGSICNTFSYFHYFIKFTHSIKFPYSNRLNLFRHLDSIHFGINLNYFELNVIGHGFGARPGVYCTCSSKLVNQKKKKKRTKRKSKEIVNGCMIRSKVVTE